MNQLDDKTKSEWRCLFIAVKGGILGNMKNIFLSEFNELVQEEQNNDESCSMVSSHGSFEPDVARDNLEKFLNDV